MPKRKWQTNLKGKIKNFLGTPSECSTISIPLLQLNHFFVCRVNFDGAKLEICDTDDKLVQADSSRLALALNAVRLFLK